MDEVRAARIDLAARAEFAEDGESIHETRAILSGEASDEDDTAGLSRDDLRQFEMDAVEMR